MYILTTIVETNTVIIQYSLRNKCTYARLSNTHIYIYIYYI